MLRLQPQTPKCTLYQKENLSIWTHKIPFTVTLLSGVKHLCRHTRKIRCCGSLTSFNFQISRICIHFLTQNALFPLVNRNTEVFIQHQIFIKCSKSQSRGANKCPLVLRSGMRKPATSNLQGSSRRFPHAGFLRLVLSNLREPT